MNRLTTQVLTIVALAGTVLFCQGAADAQYGGGYGNRWYAPGGYRSGGYGGYGYGGDGGATTAAQANMQGMSQVMRASGAAADDYSKARINNEQARSAYIQNQQLWFNTYHEMRKKGLEMQAAQAAEDAQKAQRYLANYKSALPPRLTSSQLDPTTGKIVWPRVLREDQFAESRKSIEDLSQLLAVTNTTVDLDEGFHKQAKAMQNQLKSVIRDVPTDEYLEARIFLVSLAYEGQYFSH